MSRAKNPYHGYRCPPPFAEGQLVRPNGRYSYPGWKDRMPRAIHAIEYDDLNECWTLKISNPQSPNGFSKYNPANFETAKVSQLMGATQAMPTERTKYFAIKLNADERVNLNGGFWLMDVNVDHDADENHYDTTPLKDTQHQVRVDVANIIKEGECFIVCQTICMIEGEAPRPPIKVTDFR